MTAENHIFGRHKSCRDIAHTGALIQGLTAVTEAARSIAAGDFAGRALTAGSFGEVDRLIRDFNRMAEQLQRAEQELQFSNSAIAH